MTPEAAHTLAQRLRSLRADETSTQLEEAIKVAGETHVEFLAEDVMSVMERTRVRILRNAAAYYFHETPLPLYLPRLVGVATRPDVRTDDVGTLMYALTGYDCSDYVSFLASVVVIDFYEPAQHACTALEALPALIPAAGAAEALNQLRRASPEEPWRRELVEIAIAELSERTRG